MFELQGVSKHYGQVQALTGIDLNLPSARCTALIGQSGCGKSTLLKLLLGLELPTGGEVRFDGQVLVGEAWIGARQRIGYVPQEGGLFPHLSARDNVTLVARHLGWTPEACAARVEELAALVQLPKAALKRFPNQLSGGQRQRAALMRALLLDPAALLLDEPLGALDPMIRFDLQEDLAMIFSELDKTVVLVTHDLSEAAFLGQEVVLLNAGRVHQSGTIEDLLERPVDGFAERFVRAQRPHLGTGAAR